MAHLIKIGNSQGIRIPKVLIEQAHLENTELSLLIVNDGILVSPKKKLRQGWKEAIANQLSANASDEIDVEWLEASLTEDEELK